MLSLLHKRVCARARAFFGAPIIAMGKVNQCIPFVEDADIFDWVMTQERDPSLLSTVALSAYMPSNCTLSTVVSIIFSHFSTDIFRLHSNLIGTGQFNERCLSM